MTRSRMITSWLFLFTLYCSFSNPCIRWILHNTNTASLKLQDEFVTQYHYSFPEHLDVSIHKTCSSKWRVEGYIYRNDFNAPFLNSIFGAFGSSNSSRSEIIQLNFSVSDVQIPDRDAEHVLIEYLISDKSHKRNQVLHDLIQSFNKQLLSIMEAESLDGPIYLKSGSNSSTKDHLEFWLKQDFDFKTLR